MIIMLYAMAVESHTGNNRAKLEKTWITFVKFVDLNEKAIKINKKHKNNRIFIIFYFFYLRNVKILRPIEVN